MSENPQCWQCAAALEGAGAVCAQCAVVQPLRSGLNSFELLGFETLLDLPADDIQARRRSLLSAVHPDRFTAHSAQARGYALAQSQAVNDAARLLKDPLRRVEVLLRMRGWTGAQLPQPEQHFRGVLDEYREAVKELVGVDAHDERERMTQAMARWFQERFDTLKVAFAQSDAFETHWLTVAAELHAVWDLLQELADLDTTQDRTGRLRR